MPPKPEIINILGEQVSFEQTSFDPSEKFLVSFNEKYKLPDMTPQQETLLKALFQKLFSGSSVFSKASPLPPCSDDEKQLLLKSLTYRFTSLRNELIAERQSQTDSLRLRQILDHLQRLKEYIDFAKSSEACEELDEDILAESIGDLSDEEILQLLKQFVFFVLQGQHPLEDFKGRDPNPKGFVARLSKKPMTDFDHFLDVYRHKKQPIPLPIQQVLEATKVDVQAMKEEVENSFQEKLQSVLAAISNVLPPQHPFWTNLDTSKLELIIDRLLETVQQLESDLDDCNKQSLKDQSTIMDLDTERQRLEQELRALQGKLQIAQFEQNSLEEESLTNNTSSEELEEVRQEAQRTIQALQERIQQMEREISDLNDLLDDTEASLEEHKQEAEEKGAALEKCKELETTNRKLLVTLQSYEQKLADATKRIKECEEAENRVKVLEKTLQTRETELANLRSQAGPLTQEIDKHLREKAELDVQIEKAREEAGELKSLLANITAFLESLSQEKSIVVNLLGNIQRERSTVVSRNDPILQKINSLRQTLSQTNSVPANLATEVTLLLKDVQEEVSAKEREITQLQSQIEEKDSLISAAKQQMEESNVLLQQIRNGRLSVGKQFGTDKEFLDAAIRSVEAEEELKKVKAELETALQESTAKANALQQDMIALQARHQREMETIQEQLTTRTQELDAERAKSTTLQSTTVAQQEQLQTLQESLQVKEQEAKTALQQLEQERTATIQKIAELEETRLRECNEKLEALRQEEEKKRQELVGLQGAEKGTLEGKIQELLGQITGIEGQRDTFKAELDVEKEKLSMMEANYEQTKAEHEATVQELERRLKEAEEGKTKSSGDVKALEGKVGLLLSEIEELRSKIIADGTEKAKLFEMIGKVSEWITSGGTIEKPDLDQTLNQKYGVHRLLDSFLASLPEEEEQEQEDSISTSMSRCYLVFFITYVYARHFPTKTDGDSSYQSEITAFLNGILTELYKQLEVGIPGKLEPVGSGGIPVQLKSKYVMNLLMPLIKQMELVHESGKKGADFLKYSLLDKDQLETLHKLHRIVGDKLKLTSKDIMKTLNMYVIRKTGNVDDDIANLYLRFFHETKTDKEYPVILYTLPDAKEIPKATFGTEVDFTQFLASAAQKPTQKVGSPIDKQLVTKPIFSFNLLFYLFLFVVKDYLSSVEGELDKAGCPLPQILKHH